MGTEPTVLVVQHEASTGPGWFGLWLADAGLRLDVRHPYAGEPLPSLDGYAGLLVLGGAMGPTDDDACPWLAPTRALLAEAVERALPVFGICLGAQLLAVACGGEVIHGRNGPELGVLPFEMRAEAVDDPVFAALPARPEVLQWHWEEISVLPPGAVWLGGNAAYPHQAYRLGRAAWAVQGHPEVTPAIAAAWAREDSPLLLAAGRRPEDLVAEMAERAETLARIWQPVADRFAAVVQGNVRPAAHPTPATPATPLPR